MATRRTRRSTGPDMNRTTAARAIAIAEQLHHECCILLELYRKKEGFTADVSVADARLVSVPPPSSQLDTRDKLWCLHSALLQCLNLMEKAVAKEEEELGNGNKGEYDTQRKMVKDRLSLLLISIRELLKSVDGTAAVTPNTDGSELDTPSSLFDLKLWVYGIFKEVDFWTKMTITTLQALPTLIPKERGRTTRARSMRHAH